MSLEFKVQAGTTTPVGGTSGQVEKNLGSQLLNFGSSNNLIDATNSFISFFWDIATVILIVFIAVAGVKFLSSGGDKAKAEEAKMALQYAIIALILLITINLFVFDFIIDLFGAGRKTFVEVNPTVTQTSTN